MQFPRAIGGEAADRSREGREKVQSSGGLHHRHRLYRPFGPEKRTAAKSAEAIENVYDIGPIFRTNSLVIVG